MPLFFWYDAPFYRKKQSVLKCLFHSLTFPYILFNISKTRIFRFWNKSENNLQKFPVQPLHRNYNFHCNEFRDCPSLQRYHVFGLSFINIEIPAQSCQNSGEDFLSLDANCEHFLNFLPTANEVTVLQ